MAHLRKKDERKWQIILNVGIDPKTGKQKRKTKVVNATKTKAKEIMHKLAAKYENDVYNEDIETTVEEYLKRWLKEYCENNLAKRTYNDYRGVIENHLIPSLGKLKLKNLKPDHIIKYQNKKLKNGRLKRKGGLSKRTVQNHHRILSKALTDAVIPYKLIQSNPCRDVPAPTPNTPEVNPFSKDEISGILEYIEEEYYFYALVYVDKETGLRRGELLALKWKDINLENNNIYIQRSVQEIRGEGLVYKEPKNDSSFRNIYVDDDVMAILKNLKKAHLKTSHKDNLVFAFPDGSRIRPDYVTKKFKRILRKLDLGEHRFHDLRHTHATELLQAGVNPKIVQERLGHHDVAVTLNIYSHVIPSMQKEAVEKLKEYQNKDSNADIAHINKK